MADTMYTPSAPMTYSITVDKVGRRVRIVRSLRIVVAIFGRHRHADPGLLDGHYCLQIALGRSCRAAEVFFTPTLEGFVNLLTDRSVLTAGRLKRMKERTDLQWYDQIALANGQTITGPSQYTGRLLNSIIIAGASTVIAVGLGLLAAYAFSRFQSARRIRPALLYPEHAHVARRRGDDPYFSHVPPAGAARHPSGAHPALHRLQSFADRVAAQGLHGRDPA